MASWLPHGAVMIEHNKHNYFSMVYMIHRYSNLLHKITRVLNFGRFKGCTIWEVYCDNPGYLAWCERNLGKPFMDALTPRERHLVTQNQYGTINSLSSEKFMSSSINN